MFLKPTKKLFYLPCTMQVQGTLVNMRNCSFSTSGEGRFTPERISKPALGNKKEAAKVDEEALSVVLFKHQKNAVLAALNKSHPYETVAYELLRLENQQEEIGLGSIGDLEKLARKRLSE